MKAWVVLKDAHLTFGDLVTNSQILGIKVKTLHSYSHTSKHPYKQCVPDLGKELLQVHEGARIISMMWKLTHLCCQKAADL